MLADSDIKIEDYSRLMINQNKCVSVEGVRQT